MSVSYLAGSTITVCKHMELIDHLSNLASRVQKQVTFIQTEEATKNALVLPFLNALGYNVFDPTEVVPEFVADIGTKKGEKVDYAIFRDGKPIILIECKHVGNDLNINHAGQLFRYFHVTEARIGILTNGITYRLFTDSEQPNKMDERPFMEFNLFSFNDHEVAEIKKLSKADFSIDEMLAAAHDLKYVSAFKTYLDAQFTKPSEEFVRFVAKQIYDGVLTPRMKDQFSALLGRTMQQFLNEKLAAKFKSVLADNGVASTVAVAPTEAPLLPAQTNLSSEREQEKSIVTTVEETEGFMIVRAILRKNVAVSRVVMRDVQSYCGILLDDNNRKPICRLHFNGGKKFITLFDGEEAERIDIENLDDLYQYASRIRATVAKYDLKPAE